MAFMNGEVVFSGNITSKRVDELKDICWALAGRDDGTKDVLIVIIKMHLTDPAIQNSLKFSGLYFSHHPAAADENAPPPSPALHPDLALALTSALTSASAPHLPPLPPPSYYHSAHMPSLSSITSTYRPYFPLQPSTQSHSNDNNSTICPSSSVHSQQPVNDFSTIQSLHFYSL